MLEFAHKLKMLLGAYMSKQKIEIEYSTGSPLEEKEKEKEEREDGEKPRIEIGSSTYTEDELLNRIEQTGLLDNYKNGKEIMRRSVQWIESFSNEGLVQIFANFPSVFDRCRGRIERSLGPAVISLALFNDIFCDLFANVLEPAKNIHLKHHWGFGEDTEEFHKFELALSLLHGFLEEDFNASKKKAESIGNALNIFAESNFVSIQKTEDAPLCTQLRKIVEEKHCSAGFADKLSRIYTALILARATVFYGNILQKKLDEKTEVPAEEDPKGWDYKKSASFFKIKPELKKKMESSLYHGDIDTEKAKRLLRNPGDYLIRYSSNRDKYYFTIALDNSNEYRKIVLNWEVPIDKLEDWIKNPIANREEIECFIKEKLSGAQSKELEPFVAKFFEKEQYSPIFNPLCNADILNASPRIG